ncbi:MAG: hypothetical protein HAW58_06815, partial [Candidatus Thioglobus sp.]|nr:hypothetical protein [Candidatus Thioglobus sp.]
KRKVVSLKLYSDDYKKADETAYLVYSDKELKYAGEYTYNLEDRWLSGNKRAKTNYSNHHKNDKIKKELDSGKEVSLWLAVSPYCTVKGKEINIGKSIEQEILRDSNPEWNTRNTNNGAKNWRSKNCIRLDEFKNL